MRAKTIVGLIFSIAFALTPAAHANTIVDTGPGPSGDCGPPTNCWALNSNQWLAAEFATTQPWIITSIEGWIAPFGGGDVTFALYSDGGDTPGSELFSQVVNIAPNNVAGWHGPSGLNWPLLAAGSYWVAFEVRPGSLFANSMPSPSGTPLINEAFTLGGVWTPFDPLNIGVRIEATEVNAVPDSGSSILLWSIAVFGMFTAGVVRPFR